MKKMLSVAATTLKLLFRGGAAWGLLIISSAFAVFIFFSASAGDALIDELRIRVEYSLYASSTLLNLALIYFSCVSLRKEIDERRFHTISAAPVRRSVIWLGKFLGVLSLGAISFLTISLSIAVSSVFLIYGWTRPEQVAELKSDFYRAYHKCEPDLTDLEKQVAATYAEALVQMENRKKAEKRHHEDEGDANGSDDEHAHPKHQHHGNWEGEEWRSRKNLLAEIRKSKQIIAPGTTAKWNFKWVPESNRGENVMLRFKFYTNSKRRQSEGVWSVLDENGRKMWSGGFKGYPFIEHELKIPSKFMPETRVFTLAYKEISPTYVIFPVYNKGLTILYDDSGLLENFCVLFIFALAHMAVLVALALMFSAMFSYSVAVFSTISLYTVASFSSFFHHILADLSFHDQTLSTRLFAFIIQSGLWLAEGAKELPVKYLFAQGVSIPISELVGENAAGFIIYLAFVVVVGTATLTRKEIDKILQA
ncbi:MAG: hypothetical protein GXP32_05010 [Kiritimatiellaeota bacterium]|nr:hypothetical protein [Kiritimatiellota bacterium]